MNTAIGSTYFERSYIMNLDCIKNNVVKVILQFSVPSIIAMVLTSMITIVDGFFIGNYIGSEGIAAVNLGLPILYLFLAVGLMLSVGGSAIAGMSLGSKDYKDSRNVFNQTILVTVTASVLLSLLCILLFKPITYILHAEGMVAEYFHDYYRIMLFVYPFMVVNSALGMFVRAEGKPQYYMLVNIVNVICNICLDYLFIRELEFGVKGIAYASFISVGIGFLLTVIFFYKNAKVFRFARFKFNKLILKNMILNGSSEFIGEMSMCISMFAYNWVIIRHIGVDGVAAFTIVGYVSYLFSMIVVGFGQGASPLISFTYGACESRLSIQIRRKTNVFVFAIGVIFLIVMILGSGIYGNLFVKEETVRKMVQSGMMIFVISFLFSGINTITSFFFTSIGKAKESAVISSSRGFLLLLICIFTLPVFWGMTGVWLVAPITEGVTFLISIFYIHRLEKSVAFS